MKGLAASILILFGCTAGAKALDAPSPAEHQPKKIARVSAQNRTRSEASSTTSTTLPIAPDALCPQWWTLAREVGWSENELEMLDFIIWRESRCLPDAWNGADAGLTQINQIHTHFVEVMGYTFPEGMFDPRSNLTFALKLWTGKGWEPWGY